MVSFCSLDWFEKTSLTFSYLLVLTALDKIYFLWFYFFEYVVKIVVVIGAIHPQDPYIDYHRNRAHENRYVSVSTWLHAYSMLWLKEDMPDLVIAAYDEDLSWVKDYQPYVGRIHIYCKHKQFCARGLTDRIAKFPQQYTVVKLPNIGREAHTYLSYIYDYYSALPKRVVFTMGSIKGNYGRHLSLVYALADSKTLRYCYPMKKDILHKIAHLQRFGDTHRVSLSNGYTENNIQYVKKAQIRPLYRWLNHHIGVDMRQLTHRCGYSDRGAIFSVDGTALSALTRKQYLALLDENSSTYSTEQGYFMEYSWRLLFDNDLGIDARQARDITL